MKRAFGTSPSSCSSLHVLITSSAGLLSLSSCFTKNAPLNGVSSILVDFGIVFIIFLAICSCPLLSSLSITLQTSWLYPMPFCRRGMICSTLSPCPLTAKCSITSKMSRSVSCVSFSLAVFIIS
ncbi:unnamed protein product [Spodoptera exigua]|nr:unnamed protein product [Spodoptera exigua]